LSTYLKSRQIGLIFTH